MYSVNKLRGQQMIYTTQQIKTALKLSRDLKKSIEETLFQLGTGQTIQSIIDWDISEPTELEQYLIERN